MNISKYRHRHIPIILAFVLTIMAAVAAKPARAVVIDSDTVRRAVVDSVLAVAARHGLDVEVDVPYASHISVAGEETARFTVDVPFDGGFGPRVRTEIGIVGASGGDIRRVVVIAHVRTFAAAVVAKEHIQREEAIDASSVAVERCDVTGIDDYFPTVESLEGTQAKWRIAEGRVLDGRIVESIPVVRRGDRVTVRLSIGSVQVTTMGTAREHGGMNDFIRVYSEDTRTTLECKVTGPGTVVVGHRGG